MDLWDSLHLLQKEASLRRGENSTSLYPWRYFWFGAVAIPAGIRWYLTVVCLSSLVDNDIEVSMCLLVVCISSFKKYLFRSFAPF